MFARQDCPKDQPFVHIASFIRSTSSLRDHTMARLKLTLEYEGTRYSGWQRQQNARTVEGALEEAIINVCNTRSFELYGAGRTDAGVHALHQVAHLDIKTMLALEPLRYKLNDELPADINIISIDKVHPAFHARHDATARSYLYQISRRRTAFGKRYVWWVKDRLDVSQIAAAMNLFSGMHDFASFTDDDPDERSTKVQIESVEVGEAGDLILIRIVGSHFIWKMVRRLVGVAVEAGRGKMSLDEIQKMLIVRSDVPAKLTAPPSGLFMERVYYRDDDRLQELHPMLNVGS